MASSKETYCLCGQPYNIGQFMIECDCCREWFHGSCVDVKIYQSDDIDKYHCPKCCQTYGPSVLKIPTNNHRADRYEIGAEARPAQTGAPAWIRALSARPLRPLPAALQRMSAYQFTEEFVRDNGFTRPVLIQHPEGLDIKVPNPATFTVRSVLRYCGAQLEVEVIDVRKQASLRMPLGEFVDYFETPPESRDDKVLNVLSLEFSDTNMSPLVEPPALARKLDWAGCVWAGGVSAPRPAVQKYCLMSAGGAFTDWHVDFGGTTVWYHLMHGRKVFYLAPPTATNLALYQQWSASNNQNERFLGDMLEWYGTVELTSAQTLFIPSGWIHAVYTPCDSLVFGGNFLHSYAIEMQLQIYEMERRVETPLMFRYPLFEPMHWYAAAHLLTLLRRYNDESQDEDFIISENDLKPPPAMLPTLLLKGIKTLAGTVKEWHGMKSSDPAKRDNVPKCLNSGQLVRELAKELRTFEKRTLCVTKDKDFKTQSKAQSKTSPTKSHAKKQSNQKKSLKLTLPKPIMHMGQNGENQFVEEKMNKEIFTEKPFVETKDVYHDRYIPDVKYSNGLPEAKTFVVEGKELVFPDKGYAYQSYEELPAYEASNNGYIERHEKKNGGSVLRIKLNNPPSGQIAPPPYPLPEHSILKSQLTSRSSPKPVQQWTLTKKDLGEYQEEQILFTNDQLHVQPDMAYGPGMYSAEDIQQDYPYTAEVKGQQFNQYVYSRQYDPQYTQLQQYAATPQQPASSYAAAPAVIENGTYHELPSYDAHIAQQYQANYVIEEEAPVAVAATAAAAAPVRRSERPARRRVSPTYDYEDGDLFIDDAPPKARHRKYTSHATSSQNNSTYRERARPLPANGIESLIQASVLAEEPNSTTEDVAVAGMLSIGSRYSADRGSYGLANDAPPSNPAAEGSSKKRRKEKPRPVVEDVEEEEMDAVKEVHRDDEYVYPALDMSSDEEEDWSSSRRRRNSRNKHDAKGKTDKDGLWSPRARLGRLVPRIRAPTRNVRRSGVRAALHAAATRTHPQVEEVKETNAKRAVIATKSKRPPPPAQTSPTSSKNSRLKKGMKTAKQRLGKILKIHKMIY